MVPEKRGQGAEKLWAARNVFAWWLGLAGPEKRDRKQKKLWGGFEIYLHGGCAKLLLRVSEKRGQGAEQNLGGRSSKNFAVAPKFIYMVAGPSGSSETGTRSRKNFGGASKFVCVMARPSGSWETGTESRKNFGRGSKFICMAAGPSGSCETGTGSGNTFSWKPPDGHEKTSGILQSLFCWHWDVFATTTQPPRLYEFN